MVPDIAVPEFSIHNLLIPLFLFFERRSLSLFLFMGNVLSPKVKRAFHCLREAAVHYMGAWKMEGLTFEEFEKRAQEGHLQIMEYAKLAQEIFGDGICTYNLHTLACRGYKQEQTRGPAWRETEFWVERLIQELKQRVKYRAKAMAEAVLINDLLDTMAISRMRSQDPRSDLKTIDELVSHKMSTSVSSSRRNVDLDGVQIELAGSNEQIPKRNVGPLRRLLAQYWKDFYEGDEWGYEDVAQAELFKCTRCTLKSGGKETRIRSEAYRRTSSSLSHYVLVTYDFQNRVCQHVAKVKMFSRLIPPSFYEVTEELTLAVVDLYDAHFTTDGTATSLPMLEVDDMRAPAFRDYPVKVQDIKETLIVCLPDNSIKGYFITDEVDEGL